MTSFEEFIDTVEELKYAIDDNLKDGMSKEELMSFLLKGIKGVDKNSWTKEEKLYYKVKLELTFYRIKYGELEELK